MTITQEELTEEKFLNDPDDMLFNNDETDPNEDQFAFNLDASEQLASNFLDDESNLENLAEFESNETEDADFMEDVEDMAAADAAETAEDTEESAPLPEPENDTQQGSQ